jgi:Bacterial SH3 domain
MKKIIYILTATSLIILFALPVMAADNATITGDGLRVRDKPALNGNKVGSLNKGYRVEAVSHSDHTDSIDGFTGYWYFIVYKNLSGWVFGKYIQIDIRASIPSERDFTPKTPTGSIATLNDILGDWPMHYDAPNVIYSFYNGGKVKFVMNTIVGNPERVVTYPPVWGSYVFDGKTIQVNWNDGTNSTFFVNKTYGVTDLTVDGKLLPTELHMLSTPEDRENFRKYD